MQTRVGLKRFEHLSMGHHENLRDVLSWYWWIECQMEVWRPLDSACVHGPSTIFSRAHPTHLSHSAPFLPSHLSFIASAIPSHVYLLHPRPPCHILPAMTTPPTNNNRPSAPATPGSNAARPPAPSLAPGFGRTDTAALAQPPLSPSTSLASQSSTAGLDADTAAASRPPPSPGRHLASRLTGRHRHLAPHPITDDAQPPPTSGIDNPTPEADTEPDPKLGDTAQRSENPENPPSMSRADAAHPPPPPRSTADIADTFIGAASGPPPSPSTNLVSMTAAPHWTGRSRYPIPRALAPPPTPGTDNLTPPEADPKADPNRLDTAPQQPEKGEGSVPPPVKSWFNEVNFFAATVFTCIAVLFAVGALVPEGWEFGLFIMSCILLPIPTYLLVQSPPELRRILLVGSVSLFIGLYAAKIAVYPHCVALCFTPLKHYETVRAFRDQCSALAVETQCMEVCLPAIRGTQLNFQVYFYQWGNGTVWARPGRFSPLSQWAFFIPFTFFTRVSEGS